MYGINEIRKAFSKANVVVGQNGIFMSYIPEPDPDGAWVYQVFEDESKLVFDSVTQSATGIKIMFEPGSGAIFCFLSNKIIDGDIKDMVFSRLEEPEKQKGFEEIMREIENVPASQEHLELADKFFEGVDITSDDDIFTAGANWVLACLEQDSSNVRSISVERDWRTFYKKARKFSDLCNGFSSNVEFSEPNDFGNSCGFSISFTSAVENGFHLPDEATSAFKDLLSMSSAVGFEIGVVDDEVIFNIDVDM